MQTIERLFFKPTLHYLGFLANNTLTTCGWWASLPPNSAISQHMAFKFGTQMCLSILSRNKWKSLEFLYGDVITTSSVFFLNWVLMCMFRFSNHCNVRVFRRNSFEIFMQTNLSHFRANVKLFILAAF